MKNNGFSAERKDKVKILRSIGEGIILISLLIIILKSLLSFSVYEPYEAEEFSNTGDTGFIAVSYFHRILPKNIITNQQCLLMQINLKKKILNF